MITIDQIRIMLQQLTLSRISLDEFDEWLTANSWNMHQAHDVEVVRLVGTVERLLAEEEEGYISERQMYDQFGKLSRFFRLTDVQGVEIFTAGLTKQAVRLPQLIWSVVADTKPESVSAFFPHQLVSQ